MTTDSVKIRPKPEGLDRPYVGSIIKTMSKVNVAIYRWTGGLLGSKWRVGAAFPWGVPVLLLTSIGRKSGQPRIAPLLFIEDGDNVIIVGSQGGLPKDPLWYKNLQANPECEVQIMRRKMKMKARRTTPTSLVTRPGPTGSFRSSFSSPSPESRTVIIILPGLGFQASIGAMLRSLGLVIFAVLIAPGVVRAGNSEDVVAGADVALTGGAVVANVRTGGAMWFNPAGVARLDSRSVDLTGAILSYSVASAPGSLSIESGEQSEGSYSAIQAIPRALTFVAAPRPELRWGVGFFFSRSFERFVQDQVATAEGADEPSEFYATADESKSVYHLSGTLAWKKSEKFLLGGGVDIVIATRKLTEIVTGAYAMGAGGTFNTAFNQSVAGGGLQMKLGVQWAPIKQLRIGWMAATPSYLVYLNNETTATRSLSPPGAPPQFQGTQVDDLGGGWTGVEAGLTRLGAAFLGKWGWVEADMVLSFPLNSPALGFDWKTTANARVGGVFRLTERLKLGAGFFTDLSPERAPSEFSETQIDFYGFTVGIDFANRPETPKRHGNGFYVAFAVALRYAHGSGKIAGLRFASTFPNPASVPAQINIVRATVNDLGINLALKASF